jgi:hypothetical protein
MNTNARFERCLAFINCQLQPAAKPAFFLKSGARWRAVTISRQAGSGGRAVADKLADYLQAHAPNGAGSWAVLDRDLVEKVLDDPHLPARLARFMPEDRVSQIQAAEMIGNVVLSGALSHTAKLFLEETNK